jgi:phosphohistidine phosphatase
MPEYLIMRHAKSEHPPGVPDRDRPLSDRGRRSALAVGRAITEYGAIPSTILSSPAVRARSTAELARSAGEWQAPIEIVEDLYGGGVGAVLDALARAQGRVLVVGHEPTWSMTVETLMCVETQGPPEPSVGMLRWMIHPRLLG